MTDARFEGAEVARQRAGLDRAFTRVVLRPGQARRELVLQRRGAGARVAGVGRVDREGGLLAGGHDGRVEDVRVVVAGVIRFGRKFAGRPIFVDAVHSLQSRDGAAHVGRVFEEEVGEGVTADGCVIGGDVDRVRFDHHRFRELHRLPSVGGFFAEGRARQQRPRAAPEVSHVGTGVTLSLEEADPFDRHRNRRFEPEPQLHRVRVGRARGFRLGAVEDARPREVRHRHVGTLGGSRGRAGQQRHEHGGHRQKPGEGPRETSHNSLPNRSGDSHRTRGGLRCLRGPVEVELSPSGCDSPGGTLRGGPRGPVQRQLRARGSRATATGLAFRRTWRLSGNFREHGA